MRARPWSLRGRLTWLLAASALVAWAISSAWLYRSAVAEANRLFDAALIETAHAVLAVADREISKRERDGRKGHHSDDDNNGDRDIELPRIDHAHEEHMVYQVRRGDGAIVYRSPGAPMAPLGAPTAVGFAEVRDGDVSYRVFSLRAGPQGATIHVGQPMADRLRLSRDSALRLVLPGAVLLLVLVVGVGLVVRRVTQPVVRFSRSIDALEPDQAANVAYDELPRELAPVGLALERLLERVRAALRHERTLTADAAHELRTPLAALRAQAQVALRATDADERNAALRALMTGVDRATGLVSAVLTMARLDARGFDPASLAPTDLALVVEATARELAPIAKVRGVTLVCTAVPAVVRGDTEGLVILLRNLVDNAIRLARSRVEVTIEPESGSFALLVADDGPGVAPEMAQRVFDRFFRSQGSDHGAGLGLALVQRVAELHGATVTVARAALGGALFRVSFPAPGAV
ncbi:MAG: sensor histidine kinase N-terminal domain-containing protein [Burkholderiales bacterium]|nr:sensor histidine kinase N-terminal domain-containing protein [Burkholderiales bacterium]